MSALKIQVISSDVMARKEFVAAEISAATYDPDLLGQQINQVIQEGIKRVAPAALFEPEISIQLIEEGVRPSLLLDQSTIAILAAIGASVDFDPYV